MAEIRWLGHNGARIRAREATILCDPPAKATGYAVPKQTADIVTLSSDAPAVANLDAVKGDHQIVRGPGEYEMHDVFITGIRAYQGEPDAADRRHTTAYLIEIEGLRVCHLGNLGHALSAEQTEALADVDVLLIPAGGTPLPVAKAAEVVSQLEPQIVIPLQFATAQGDRDRGALDAFCKELGVAVPDPEEKLSLRHADLPDPMRVVVLAPSG